ncbi:hypothetical protein [Streptomyces sp. NRRL S-1824]|uniref:hypothetical protein n=1 Tax=Streptomyces sp. NRRL S-1824 TaxID=1463889 RepID=UPI001F1E2BFF|nr:hypothetical protein [Streptomyces sp. NRRL S-1824]
MLTDQLIAGGLAPLAGIATALREDRPAVARGITTLYNSGVNEGRITEVKLQKTHQGRMRQRPAPPPPGHPDHPPTPPLREPAHRYPR